jgi:hypothetical protein
VLDAPGLDEHQCLEEFVHGPEAAGHGHVGRGVFHEHELAHEEVAEIDLGGQVLVGGLLEGQVDV